MNYKSLPELGFFTGVEVPEVECYWPAYTLQTGGNGTHHSPQIWRSTAPQHHSRQSLIQFSTDYEATRHQGDHSTESNESTTFCMKVMVSFAWVEVSNYISPAIFHIWISQDNFHTQNIIKVLTLISCPLNNQLFLHSANFWTKYVFHQGTIWDCTLAYSNH